MPELRDTTILAYAAGIIDGEGWIGVAKVRQSKEGTQYYRPTVQVNMVTQLIPELMYQLFGGRLCEKPPRLHCHRPQWTWTVSGPVAEACIRELLPYLRLKRPQAIELLKLRDSQRGRTRWNKTEADRQQEAGAIATLYALNGRGAV